MERHAEQLKALKKMTIESVEECDDVELLELVWKILADAKASE